MEKNLFKNLQIKSKAYWKVSPTHQKNYNTFFNLKKNLLYLIERKKEILQKYKQGLLKSKPKNVGLLKWFFFNIFNKILLKSKLQKSKPLSLKIKNGLT